jgi:Raf kinase inhibitor-like YbhB/YbcL family protein
MKKLSIIFTALMFALNLLNAQTFTLTSKSVGGQATNKQVFNGFGCSGENVSPQLSWTNAPKDTKSFAVTVYDPDAPTGSGWWHWVVFDIPANVSELVEGAGDVTKNLAPKGCIQSLTDMGKPGFGGPCPPEGDKPHKYEVTVFALKTDKLGLDQNANPALVGFMMNQNILAKATIVFYYKR